MDIQMIIKTPLLLDAINHSYHIWTEGEVITLKL
jgi:hypothetical protein